MFWVLHWIELLWVLIFLGGLCEHGTWSLLQISCFFLLGSI